jgi:uncharacterized protein YaeQ
MALGATIFKVQLQISDLNRHYYAEHDLTLARHPSETDERMMVRMLAFARHADEELNFTRGLCADEEPDLWQRDLTGAIDLWIEIGLPDERRLRKACSRAKSVCLYLYGGRSAAIWWQRNAEALKRFDNLQVVELCFDPTGLTRLVTRSMALQCTLQDDEIWLNTGDLSCPVALKTHQPGR